MARNTAHHQRLLSKILESPFSFAYGRLPKRPSPLLAVSAGGSWDKVEHQDCDSMVLSFTFTSFTWKPWYFSRWSFGGWNSSEVGEVWTTGSVTPPVTRHGTWDPWQLSLLLLLRSFEPLRPDYNLHEFHTASGLVIHESKRKNNQTHKICMCIDMYIQYILIHAQFHTHQLCLSPQVTSIQWFQPDLVRMTVVSIREHSQLRDLLTQFLNANVLWMLVLNISSLTDSASTQGASRKIWGIKLNHQPNIGWSWLFFVHDFFLVGYSTLLFGRLGKWTHPTDRDTYNSVEWHNTFITTPPSLIYCNIQ